MRTFSASLAFVALASLLGCAQGAGELGGDAGSQPPGNDPMPDFSLEDVNPTSATFETAVSPRDMIGRVSAWYFGHAT